MHILKHVFLTVVLCTTMPLICMQKSISNFEAGLLPSPSFVQVPLHEQEEEQPKNRSWCCCRTRKAKLATSAAATAALLIACVPVYNKVASVVDTIDTVQTDVAVATKDISLVRQAFQDLVKLLNKTKSTPAAGTGPKELKEVARKLNITHDPITGEPV